MLFWIWSATILGALLLYLRQVYSRFSRYGVKGSTPIPLAGTMARVLLKKDHFAEDIEKTYTSFPGERFVGKFDLITPMLFLRDLELIKKITIKDFEHFLDHRSFTSEKSDPLFGRNLFSLKGEEWKDMRSTLSPAFTSSKIRLMVPFMVEVGDQMITSLKTSIDDAEGEYLEVDVKDLTTRYANDVIASCAFGLKVDSHTDKDNQFYEMGKTAATFKFKQLLLIFLSSSLPTLTKYLKITLISESTKDFFTSLVLDTMKDREARHIIRPDMIHLLMDAKKGKLSQGDKTVIDTDAGFATVKESDVGKKEVLNREWTDNDLIAQAVLFFIAGFETTSAAMSFLLYELAVNPEVQEKLYQEIIQNDTNNGGKFDYNSIQRMMYMDMVVSELLRLWPPGISLDRLCVKDYNLGKPNDKATLDYIIRKGEAVAIPAWAIHRDPEYFPDPLKFDPERFSEQNKHNINPFAYMPFGVGPRNCIGSRFALCEIKVLAYQLLKAMEVSPCERTTIPAKLCKNSANIRMDAGHWLRFKTRK